jgi:hypothetical protein
VSRKRGRAYHAHAPGGKHLGSFATAVEAALAYARELQRRRTDALKPVGVQCEACDKWRRLPAGERVGKGWWECSLHPYVAMRSCMVEQEPLGFDEEDGAALDDEDREEEASLPAAVHGTPLTTVAEGLRLCVDLSSATGYAGVSRIETELVVCADATADGTGGAPTESVRFRARAPDIQKGGWHPGVHGPRRVRCKACSACHMPACGRCAPCLDSPRFGGPGKQKQSCVLRKCTSPLLPDGLHAAAYEVQTTLPGRSLGTFKTAIEAAVAYARFVQGVEKVVWVQCDECTKWRRWPGSKSAAPRATSGVWRCSMHPEPGEGCDEPEEAMEEGERVHVQTPACNATTARLAAAHGLRPWAQCDICSKWRRLSAGAAAI